jgi:ATP-dependent DNA helicase DinG
MEPSIFGPGGLLARASGDYEERPGQLQMAAAVDGALRERRHLAIEAPCGTGKTYAYLAPAIQRAVETDTRVIVATANIALQEQIVRKDLPALSKILPRPFSWALIKGINNYLCLDRFRDLESQLAPVTFDRDELRQWERLREWADATKTGDVSELEFEPEGSLWQKVNGVRELCNGSECRYYQDCHAMGARRRLRSAQVIVTNYHLFCAHLAVKAAGAGDVILPPASAVICDEAHELADIARDFFGLRLSPFSVTHLVRGANLLRKGGISERLRQASREFFSRVREAGGGRLLKPRWIDASTLEAEVLAYQDALKEAARDEQDEDERDKIAKHHGAASHYLATLRSFLSLDDPNCVYWAQPDAKSSRLQARCIDVSGMLGEHLFKGEASVILTSATLTANGDFSFLKRETGAHDAGELQVPSPFDPAEQEILVVPKMACGPNDPGFAEEMSGHINRILRLLGGRTMCLFTSYRNLEHCAAAAASTGIRILRQGDLPRSKLLEEFRKDRGTALFATSSFWQGVDIPGEALSCLVIDKIPFTHPGDPLLEALTERDPQSFQNYSLPKAILELRQGFGRLIRRRTDRGVVLLFDTRIFTKGYGPAVLASLPPCPVTRDLAAVEKFFKSEGAPLE